MRSAIFIRTYWKDLDWLDLCLQSIERHCTGFEEVVIAVPESSRSWVEQRLWPNAARWVYDYNYADDYLGQQICKLHADLSAEADLIVHLDADCIVKRPTCPEALAPGGRPFILTRPIEDLGRHYPWRVPTQAFLGFEVALDFMQRQPLVYPRWLYPEVRRHCERMHRMPLRDYVMTRSPRGFSEFNVLGAYAWRHHHDTFDFVAAGSDAAPPEHCDWHWSWGGIDDQVRRRFDAALGQARME